MTSDKIKLLKMFQNIKSINGRVKLQKIVFLLQQLAKKNSAGNPFTYTFFYHNHGPFSKELAEEITYIDNHYGYILEYQKNDSNIWVYENNIKDKENQLLNNYHFEDIFGISESDFNRTIDKLNDYGYELLESTATIVYLVNKGNFGQDKEKLRAKLNELKPHLNDLFEEAFKLAQEYFIN